MNFVVTVRVENLLSRLRAAPVAMRAALRVAVSRLAIGVQRAVKEEKLTGQVLHVRTGTLRRSINQEVTEREDGVFAVVGTNVKYAHIHEFGFSGTVSVRAHVRRSRAQMQLARYRKGAGGTRVEIKGSYAKAGGGAGEVMVRAHDMKVNMPERSFLRSTLREWEPRIREELRAAALGVLR